LYVFDSAGCGRSAETVIDIEDVAILGFESQVYRCGPQSPAPELRLVVPANANYSYQWLPPDGLSCSDCPRPTVVDTANRSYEVLVEDRASGCTTRVGPIQFQYVQRLRAEAGTDARICKGSSIRIGANIQQPIEVEYRWQPSTNLSNPRNPSPLAAPQETTTYTLTVTATGCPLVEDTVRIEVVPQLELQAVADRMRLCAGDSVRLGIDGLGNEPTARWQWLPNLDLSSDTAARPWAKPSMSRTYTLVVQGVECPPLEPIDVKLQVDPLPAIELGADSLLICPASVDQPIELPTRNLDGRTYTYRWEPVAGIDAPLSPNPTARPTNPTVYRLTATDAATGCQFNDSIWVGVGPFVEASLSWTDSTICRGDSLAIVARGGVGSARYLWQPAEFTSCSPCASPFLKPKRSTTFTVLAEEGGCTSTASVEVRVVPRPVIDFQPNPQRGCVPLAVTMAEYGQDIRSWFWDFGDGNTGYGPSPQHVYRNPGRYRVRLLATGQAGACALSDGTLDRWVEVSDRPQPGIVWSSDAPPIVDGPPVRLRSTGSNTLEACHWDLGDGRWLSGCEVWARWPAPGEYIVQLTVRNAAGCIDTASIRLQVAPAELSEIPTVFSPNGDGVNDIWQPQAKTGQDLSVQIFDRNGREVFSGNSGWNGTLPEGSDAEPGTYTFLIRWNGRWYRGWLVLIR
jgi:gliding motility-associated-like protein